MNTQPHPAAVNAAEEIHGLTSGCNCSCCQSQIELRSAIIHRHFSPVLAEKDARIKELESDIISACIALNPQGGLTLAQAVDRILKDRKAWIGHCVSDAGAREPAKPTGKRYNSVAELVAESSKEVIVAYIAQIEADMRELEAANAAMREVLNAVDKECKQTLTESRETGYSEGPYSSTKTMSLVSVALSSHAGTGFVSPQEVEKQKLAAQIAALEWCESNVGICPTLRSKIAQLRSGGEIIR